MIGILLHYRKDTELYGVDQLPKASDGYKNVKLDHII